MAASIIYRQTVTLQAGAFSVIVTLSRAYADANYVIGLEFPYAVKWWITSKTAAGFTINVDTNSMYDQTVGILTQHN